MMEKRQQDESEWAPAGIQRQLQLLGSPGSSSEKTPPETVLEDLSNFFKSQRHIFFFAILN